MIVPLVAHLSIYLSYCQNVDGLKHALADYAKSIISFSIGAAGISAAHFNAR